MLAFFLNMPQPIGLLLFSTIITIVAFLLIPLVGTIFDKLEAYELRGMSKIFPAKFTIFFANRITIFGVIVHELSHALFAHITGASIRKISVLDIMKNGTLGHVDIGLRGGRIQRSFQSTLSACGPIIGGCFVLFLLITILRSFCSTIPQYAFIIFLIISVVNHLSMSPQDIHLYKKGLWITIPTVIIILFALLYFFQPANAPIS